MMHTEKKWLWAAVALLLFFAAFAFGAGMAQVIHRFQSQQDKIHTVLETDDGGQQLDASLSGVKIAEEMYAQANGECEVRIQNLPENENSVRVSVVRSATGEVLYQSGLIDPGHYLEYVKLDTRLKEGWYPCRVMWEFYKPDTQEPIGKAAQSAVLIVKNDV